MRSTMVGRPHRTRRFARASLAAFTLSPQERDAEAAVMSDAGYAARRADGPSTQPARTSAGGLSGSLSLAASVG